MIKKFITDVNVGDYFKDSIRGVPFAWKVSEIDNVEIRMKPFIDDCHDIRHWTVSLGDHSTINILKGTEISEPDALMLYLKSGRVA